MGLMHTLFEIFHVVYHSNRIHELYPILSEYFLTYFRHMICFLNETQTGHFGQKGRHTHGK